MGVAAFNVALALWLIHVSPTRAAFTAVANTAYAAGPLLAVLCCLPAIVRAWRARREVSAAARRRLAAAAALLTGVLCFAVGQSIWTVYENVLHRRTPFPSPADAFFIAAYLFMAAGILLLPSRAAPLLARGRLLMDAVTAMAAILTFSWYFVLAPQVAASTDSAFATALGLLYPVMDLVLLFCLLMIVGGRVRGGVGRGATVALAGGFVGVVVIDTAFLVGVMHGTYATGGIVDLGWPVGYMLIALAARHLLIPPAAGRRATPDTATDPANAAPADGRTSWFVALLPYALMPPTLALVGAIYHEGGHDLRSLGSYALAIALFVLVLVRQLLVLSENEVLCRQLRQLNASLEQSNAQLRALATTDAMTRLANHRAMQDRLREEVARSRRTAQPFALLLIDVDHFKSLNDQFGHPAGDAVLRQVAEMIRDGVRTGDLPARYGGEEFAVVCPLATAERVVTLAERLRAAIAAHAFGPRAVTVSIGVSGTDVVGLDVDGLIRSADQALYASKHDGRNRVTVAAAARVEQVALCPSQLAVAG